MKKNYIVIHMNSSAELEAEVEKALLNGYKLLGGISTTTINVEGRGEVVKYSQALILSSSGGYKA